MSISKRHFLSQALGDVYKYRVDDDLRTEHIFFTPCIEIPR